MVDVDMSWVWALPLPVLLLILLIECQALDGPYWVSAWGSFVIVAVMVVFLAADMVCG